MSRRIRVPRPDVGLCSACTHAAVQQGSNDNEFWRCRAADENPKLLKYPPLPVRACEVFESKAGADEAGGS